MMKPISHKLGVGILIVAFGVVSFCASTAQAEGEFTYGLVPCGGTTLSTVSINKYGQVVANANWGQPFFWAPYILNRACPLVRSSSSPDRSYAMDVNDYGEVVGNAFDGAKGFVVIPDNAVPAPNALVFITEANPPVFILPESIEPDMNVVPAASIPKELVKENPVVVDVPRSTNVPADIAPMFLSNDIIVLLPTKDIPSTVISTQYTESNATVYIAFIFPIVAQVT